MMHPFTVKANLLIKKATDIQVSLLFSLVQVQNQSFGPKQNAKFSVNHHHHHPPTENFSKGSRLRMGPRFGM